MCLACEALGLLPNASRIRFYNTLAAVEDDYAPGTEAYFGASAFFAQTPRPTTMAIGEVFLDDLPAMIASPALTAAQIALVAAVSDGSMTINWADGSADTDVDLTGMDFTGMTTLAVIVAEINTALGSDADLVAAVKTLPGGAQIITISTLLDGDDVTISYSVAAGSGTFVGTLLGLTAAGSGTLCQGYTATGIADELASIANAALAVDKYIYGWALGAGLRIQATQEDAATWALGRTAMLALTTNSTDALDPNITTDLGSVISAIGNRRTTLFYHDNVQRYPDVSFLAYMLHVNYRIQNSTVTGKFKQLPGIETVLLTETEWITLQSKGYNTYTAIGNNSRTVRDGVTEDIGWFVDTVINLDNFVEDLSVNVFNAFLRNKRIPYTRPGQMILVDACKDVGYLYTFNGTFADREVLDTTKKSGYSITPAVQVIPTAISLMSVADRAARIGPPIEMIVQEAGAIHSIAINVEVVS